MPEVVVLEEVEEWMSWRRCLSQHRLGSTWDSFQRDI